MTREHGAKRIFFYNWPVFVGTWLGAAAVLAFAPHTALFVVSACVALAWSIVSLAVSFYVYDASELESGAWISSLGLGAVGTWIALDAGLDAEIDLRATMPGKCAARLDIFDSSVMKAGSISRARRRTPRVEAATASKPSALAVATASCDAAVVAFSAHEIHPARAREEFFAELHRAVTPGGKLLLVEHVRDLANFLAFGPGVLHFLPRAEWLRLAAHAGLRPVLERRITPFVMALVLEKPR